MQSAKNAAASTKESAANVAASAKSGLEKTKATIQEKEEKMTSHDPVQKQMAAEKKEHRINQAELNKRVQPRALELEPEPTPIPLRALGTPQTAHKTHLGGGTGHAFR